MIKATKSSLLKKAAVAPSSTEVVFREGLITLNGLDLPEGLAIAAYVGAYTVGRALVEREGDYTVACLHVDDFPNTEYPLEIRFAEVGAGGEVCPPFVIAGPADALAHLGKEEVSASITGIFDDHITFELRPTKLVYWPRPIHFLVNGTVMGEEDSVPGPAPEEDAPTLAQPHTLRFPLTSQLQDSAVLELIELTTGTIVFSRAATWLNSIGGVMRGFERVSEQVRTLEATVAKLKAQVSKMSTQSGERLLLDRLDLFYSLIHSRMDCELRALDDKTSPAAPLPARAAPKEDVIIDAAGIEGVGIHRMEVDGERRWRWFGPRVSLVFRDVPNTCTALRLAFASVPAEMDVQAITTRVNAREVDVHPELQDGRLNLTLPFRPGFFAFARNLALIVELEFPHSFKPAGDDRLLSAAFASATLCF